MRTVAASERAASPSMVVKVEENAFAPRPEPTAKILQPLKGGCRFLADFGVVPVMFYAILWPEPCLVEGVTHSLPDNRPATALYNCLTAVLGVAPLPAPPAPPLVELGLASLQERARLHARVHTARGAPLCLARCQSSPRLSGTCCRLYCSMGGAAKAKPQWSTIILGSARSDASAFPPRSTACPCHTVVARRATQACLCLSR